MPVIQIGQLDPPPLPIPQFFWWEDPIFEEIALKEAEEAYLQEICEQLA